MLRRHLLIAGEAVVLGWVPAYVPSTRASGLLRRLALVIGNAAYPEVPLNNPANDARLIAGVLQRVGFSVTLGLDLKRADFLLALNEFAKNAREGADAVFYYAGHAVQIRGANYLLPVDIGNLSDPAWIEQSAISLDGPVLSELLARRENGGVRVLIIDACRDNPFGAGTRRPTALTAGLASVQGSANVDGGVLIATSAAPNKAAEDGPPGGNSVYTAALAREVLIEGRSIEAMLKQVAIQVDRETAQQQLPMYASSLTSEFVFNLGGRVAALPLAQVQPGRKLLVTVRADATLNQGAQRRPLRSALWIYVLRNDAAFQRAGFEAVEKLNELDVSDVPPMSHSTLSGDTSYAMRDDEPAPSLGQEAALANAPDPGEGHFKVPKVIG